ncbi:MAG: TM2 domain-containing protein [Firmicutes bacterium]|nr:TM2 domain-containing protein [Bacillota bacterium]
MQQDKIDMFLMTNAKLFPSEKLTMLRERMKELGDDKLALISSVDYKDPTTLLLVSIFLGTLGIDRFMLGETGMGILKLLTAGLCGILTIIDWFLVSNKTREYNFQKFMEVS